MAGKGGKSKGKGLLGAATKVAGKVTAPAKMAKGVADLAVTTAVNAAGEAGKVAAGVGAAALSVVPGASRSGAKPKSAPATAETRSPAAAVAAAQTEARAAAQPTAKPAPAKKAPPVKAPAAVKAPPVKAPAAVKAPAKAPPVPAKAAKARPATPTPAPAIPSPAKAATPAAKVTAAGPSPATTSPVTERATAAGPSPATTSPVSDRATAPETAATPAPPSVASTTPGAGGASKAGGVSSLPEKDLTVRPKGLAAEQTGKQAEVTRMTGQPSVAANYRTRSAEVMTAWAKARGGEPRMTPAKIGGVLNLRFDFEAGQEPGDWAAFTRAFGQRRADFIYQERVRDGSVSHNHRFSRPDKG